MGKRKTLLFILDYPLRFLLNITIPPSDEEEYDHKLLTLWPVFGGFFLYYNFWEDLTKHHLGANFFLIPFLILLQALFIFYRPKNDNSPPKYFPFICLISFFCSLLWNKLCCDYLVCIFKSIGFIFGIPVPYLGNVFLSIGNALPDGLTQIALAKLG